LKEIGVTTNMAGELTRRGLIERTDEKTYSLTEMGKVVFEKR